MATRKKPTVAKKTAKKPAKPAHAKAVATKPAAKKAPARKAVAKKAARKPVAKQTAAGKTAAKKVAPAKTAPASMAKKNPAAPPRARKKITAGQAMANTLALLEAKNEKAKQPPNYPTGDAAHSGSHAPLGVDAGQPETAPTERNPDAIHGHAFATETGDESKRSQN